MEISGKKIKSLFNEESFKSLEFDENKNYEFVKAKKGLIVLVEKEDENAGIKNEIIGLLRSTGLANKVEGQFETKLSEKQLGVFNEMLKSGEVTKFKLSDKYKKAVYNVGEDFNHEKKDEKISPKKEVKGYYGIEGKTQPRIESKVEQRTEAKGETKIQPKAEERTGITQPILDKDGFTIVRNENEAKRLSANLAQEIKLGEIRGTKTFDGEFFIASSDFLEKETPKVTKLFSEKNPLTLKEIEEKLNLDKQVIRVVNEFLKEDGVVIEKRKGVYQYIE